MRNLYNLGWGLALCSLLGACQSDGIPEVETAGSPLELRSVSLADDAVTKAVTTSVDKVKLYLKNSDNTWVNPEYSKSGITWGCTSAPLLGGTATDVYAYYPTDKGVDVSADVYSTEVTVRDADTFDGEQIDYLYATPVTASSSSKIISLKLYHALTKVSFYIYKSTSASDEVLTLTKIDIRSNTGRLQIGKADMRLNGNEDELGRLNGLAGTSSIELTGSKILETSLTQPNISCLVAPMDAAEQVLSFRLTVDVDGVEREFETASISSESGVKWLAGYHYVYKIRIDKMEGTFEGVTVYDWQNSTDQNTSVGI